MKTTANPVIFNTTIKIATAVQDSWLQWLRQYYMPALKATGCFTAVHLLQLLETEDADGATYALQCHIANHAGYQAYCSGYRAELEQMFREKWNGAFVWFSSLMAVVD